MVFLVASQTLMSFIREGLDGSHVIVASQIVGVIRTARRQSYIVAGEN